MSKTEKQRQQERELKAVVIKNLTDKLKNNYNIPATEMKRFTQNIKKANLHDILFRTEDTIKTALSNTEIDTTYQLNNSYVVKETNFYVIADHFLKELSSKGLIDKNVPQNLKYFIRNEIDQDETIQATNKQLQEKLDALRELLLDELLPDRTDDKAADKLENFGFEISAADDNKTIHIKISSKDPEHKFTILGAIR
ncbi:MAG: hypothetical protein HRU35_08305 [Rickettsiaceae bacterium]|nr:hypothetical protein [Rickettsiaceae bacterium]